MIILLSAAILIAGCATKEPAQKPVSISPGPPRHWDVGDQTLKYELPKDVADGYLEFAKAPGFSYGVTLAHERISARRHDRHDMLIYIHSGIGRFHVGEKSFFGSTGDLLFIPRGTVYAIYGQGTQQLELMTVYHPPFDGDDIIYEERAEKERAGNP